MRENKALLSAALVIGVLVSVAVGSSPCTMVSSQTGLIAFTRGEGRAQEILVRDLTTGIEIMITNNKSWDGIPTFSPSGHWLAFVRAIPDRDALEKPDFTLHEMDEIIVVDPRSGEVVCIGKSDHTEPYELGRCAEYWPDVPPLAGVTNLCWTKDETGILFEAPCSVTNDLILRMDLPSGELHILCLGNDLCSAGDDRFFIWRHEYDENGGCERCYIIDSWGNAAPCSPGVDKRG